MTEARGPITASPPSPLAHSMTGMEEVPCQHMSPIGTDTTRERLDTPRRDDLHWPEAWTAKFSPSLFHFIYSAVDIAHGLTPHPSACAH